VNLVLKYNFIWVKCGVRTVNIKKDTRKNNVGTSKFHRLHGLRLSIVKVVVKELNFRILK
jgi:hypothetical protein